VSSSLRDLPHSARDDKAIKGLATAQLKLRPFKALFKAADNDYDWMKGHSNRLTN
jgi:hypothetical protein